PNRPDFGQFRHETSVGVGGCAAGRTLDSYAARRTLDSCAAERALGRGQCVLCVLPNSVPRLFSGLLLGFLLASTRAPAVDRSAQPNGRLERLLVVRPALTDLVVRHSEQLRCR